MTDAASGKDGAMTFKECHNPNHTLANGSPYPHEIGATCMSEPKDEVWEALELAEQALSGVPMAQYDLTFVLGKIQTALTVLTGPQWQAAFRAGAESQRERDALEMVMEGEHRYAAQIRALPLEPEE